MPPLLYSNPLSPGVRAVLMTAKSLNIQLKERIIDFKAGDQMKPELTNKMAPVLYSFPMSPGVRAVLMTAKELGIQLEERFLDFAKAEHLKPEFTSINPQHTVPTLVDDGAGIWDSHAITAYLVRKYGKDDSLYPKDYIKRAIVDQRLHFDSGSFFVLLYQIVKPMWMGLSNSVPEDLAEKVKESYGFLETFLKGRQWVAGDGVTIADFSLLATATSLDIVVPIDHNKHPNIISWIKKAESQPFYEGNKAVKDYRVVLENFMSRTS